MSQSRAVAAWENIATITNVADETSVRKKVLLISVAPLCSRDLWGNKPLFRGFPIRFVNTKDLFAEESTHLFLHLRFMSGFLLVRA